MNESIEIQGTDFWVKVVGMLQQNWALIIEAEEKGAVCIFFTSDASGVFDQLAFASADAAREALRRTAFRRFAETADLQSFLRPPPAPFRRLARPNRPIYSSGRFWRSEGSE